MATEKGYILWLPSWYPNPITPYDGDFIQRHAKAVSAFIPVHVFYIIRDKERQMTRSVRFLEKSEGNLTETIIYYNSLHCGIRIFDRMLSQTKFWWLYRKHVKKLFREKGFPELVHVHIVYKAGLIARWINKKFGIPYLLTEQWTVHLPEAKPNINELPFTEQHLISKIMDHTRLVLPVSAYLGKEMKKHWPGIRFEVIPNVVNHEIFFPGEKEPSPLLRLIHISTLTWQKDPESLLKAVKVVKQRGIPVKLDLFGPPHRVQHLIHELDIAAVVYLHGEVPQTELAGFLRNSDALVLYSRYETFGCVIIEANACGVPVIVSDTRLMHELVEEGKNGFFVPPDNYMALADAIQLFFENKHKTNPQEIARTTAKYSYEKVGKMFLEIYNRFLEG